MPRAETKYSQGARPFQLDVDKSTDAAVTESCAFRLHIVAERRPSFAF